MELKRNIDPSVIAQNNLTREVQPEQIAAVRSKLGLRTGSAIDQIIAAIIDQPNFSIERDRMLDIIHPVFPGSVTSVRDRVNFPANVLAAGTKLIPYGLTIIQTKEKSAGCKTRNSPQVSIERLTVIPEIMTRRHPLVTKLREDATPQVTSGEVIRRWMNARRVTLKDLTEIIGRKDHTTLLKFTKDFYRHIEHPLLLDISNGLGIPYQYILECRPPEPEDYDEFKTGIEVNEAQLEARREKIEIGKKLKAHIKRKKMTFGQIAEITGLTANVVQNILSGNKNTSAEELERILDALEISSSTISTPNEPEPENSAQKALVSFCLYPLRGRGETITFMRTLADRIGVAMLFDLPNHRSTLSELALMLYGVDTRQNRAVVSRNLGILRSERTFPGFRFTRWERGEEVESGRSNLNVEYAVVFDDEPFDKPANLE